MSDDDEVGYGKPPKNSQFKPGHSGNPKGRPKGTRNISTLVDDELNNNILIREGTRSYKIKKLDAIVKTMVNLALKGDVRATKWVEDHRSEEPLALDKQSREEIANEITAWLKTMEMTRQNRIIDHRAQLEGFGVPEDLIIKATGLVDEEVHQLKKQVRKGLLEHGLETPLIDEILGSKGDNEGGETATDENDMERIGSARRVTRLP